MEKTENNIITKPQTKIVIAKYKRCSTAIQELTLQDGVLEKDIRRFKEDNPNIEIEILNFEDFAISGKNAKDRPALMELMEKIDKRIINKVYVTKMDRLGRSLQDLLNLTDQMRKREVDFVVVEQKIDTSTPQGNLLFQVIGAFSEFERTLIRERMEAGRRKAKETGITKSGKPLHRPALVLDEDGIMTKYERGMSINKIAEVYKVSITPIRRILKKKLLEQKKKKYLEMKKEFEEI